MVWRFPPERAGRAPHASRHSNCAEVEVIRLTLVGAELGTDSGEQALTSDATPTLPASPSS